MSTAVKPEEFILSPLKEDLEHSYEVLARQINGRGYVMTAIRMPYSDSILEFIQVDFPDGTSAYFTGDDNEDGFRAGPFGGGYSWNVPKYVLKAMYTFLRESFQDKEEAVK